MDPLEEPAAVRPIVLHRVVGNARVGKPPAQDAVAVMEIEFVVIADVEADRAQAAIAHAKAISTGGPPIFLVMEEAAPVPF